MQEEVITTEIASEESCEPDVAEVSSSEDVNYEALVEQDVAELSREFPELEGIKNITELENPIRYAALRDLGLSPAEAYLATTKKRRIPDTRSHLYSSVPGASALPKGSMSDGELSMARELFPDISDSEIRKLYKTVTK